MIQVLIQNENVSHAILQIKKFLINENVIRTVKNNRYFKTPTQKRREKRKEISQRYKNAALAAAKTQS